MRCLERGEDPLTPGYQIEGVESLGIALFERVTGDDFTAVIGLPLTKTVSLLGRFGVGVL